MKIVLVTDLYFPGVNGMITAVRGLAETFSEAGHSVTLIGPNSVAASEWAARHEIEFYPMLGLTAPARIGQRLGVWPLVGRRIRSILRQADVVHLHSPFLAGLAMGRLAHQEHVPVVVTNHALPENLTAALRMPPEFGRQLFANLIWKWIGKGQSLANVITSPSRYGAQLLQNRFGDARIQVISNGVRQPSEFSFNLIEAQGPIRTLYVGRLQREKRVDELLHAVVSCLRAAVPIQFTIVGDGPDRKRLERLARSLGICSHVNFVGLVSDDARDEYYKASHCFWIASRSELQCCAALEAMAAARPVVASCSGAISETVPNGVAGCLYSPGNLGQLVEIMSNLQHQSGLYRRLSLGALATARKHRLSDVGKAFIGIYSSLVCESRKNSSLEMHTERLHG